MDRRSTGQAETEQGVPHSAAQQNLGRLHLEAKAVLHGHANEGADERAPFLDGVLVEIIDGIGKHRIPGQPRPLEADGASCSAARAEGVLSTPGNEYSAEFDDKLPLLPRSATHQPIQLRLPPAIGQGTARECIFEGQADGWLPPGVPRHHLLQHMQRLRARAAESRNEDMGIRGLLDLSPPEEAA